MSASVLRVENLGIAFGGLKAVNNVSFDIKEGNIFGLIGPNGAGKTTVFNLITGVYKPTEGNVTLFDQHLINHLKPYQICRLGVARTFQNIRLFRELSVVENLRIAMDANPHFKYHGLLTSIFRTPGFCSSESEKTKESIELLKIFSLDNRALVTAKNLPYGDQRRLEIARALATGAKFILLDEPAAGLNPQETAELMKTIRFIRDKFKVTVLLIEHDMSLVMGICERIAVLEYGVKICEGTASQVQNDPKVIEAYLGTANSKG